MNAIIRLGRVLIILTAFAVVTSLAKEATLYGNAHQARSMRQGSPVQGGSIDYSGIFDPAFAQAELRGILVKYQQASQFLNGIALAPNPDIDSWPSMQWPASPQKRRNETNYEPSFSESDDRLLPPSPQVPPAPPPSPLNPGTGVLPLRALISPSSLELLYYGPVSVGTPAQRLTVDCDTGSADLWLPVDCWECTNKEFIPDRSSTYVSEGDSFDVSYGSGDVYGVLATETFTIGDLTVSNQTFGAVSHVSQDWNYFPNDGLIGLAFGTISRSEKPTFFENLIQEGKVAQPLFSVYLVRGREDGSEVCFGCWDPTKVSPDDEKIFWVPVVSQSYWTVLMNALIVNSAEAFGLDVIAAIDTGTTLIYVPDSVAASFYSLIPGAKPATQYGPEFYTYPCSATLDISFSFDGHLFRISQLDFNLGRTSRTSPDCVGGILALGNGFPSNLAIIGDEFLKSWYTTFDYSHGARIGFAKSVNNR